MRAPRFWWEQPGAAGAALSPVSALYGAIAARRLARPGVRAGVPVICVGNPTVGGAGKTPTVLAIVRQLAAAGERPVILSRGYGGRLAGPVTVDAAKHRAVDVGDEPLLLVQAAPTIVARDRVAGARQAREQGATVIVMDDGFQNPALVKDLSILVVDGRRGLGNGRVFPAGPLRAPLDPQLGKADALLVVGPVTGATPLLVAARARGLPLFRGTLVPDPAAVAALSGVRVLAFAGIGDPEKFFATVAAAGIDAAVRRPFPDHHRYSAAEAAALIAEAGSGKLELLTTEKDLLRIAGDANGRELAARVRTLPVALDVVESDAFRRLMLGVVGR
jgi:tetraacyldisaccharide 4'-kinase